MATFIFRLFIVRYFRFKKRAKKLNCPTWAKDAFPIFMVFPDLAVTLIYTILFPIHFYRRTEVVANFAGNKTSNRPFALMPVKYAAAALMIVNLMPNMELVPLTHLLSLNSGASEALNNLIQKHPTLLFNFLIFAQAFVFLPIFITLAVLASILVVLLMNVAVLIFTNDQSNRFAFNEEFFYLIGKSFRDMKTSKLAPRLIYYSISMCISWPLLAYFVVAATGIAISILTSTHLEMSKLVEARFTSMLVFSLLIIILFGFYIVATPAFQILISSSESKAINNRICPAIIQRANLLGNNEDGFYSEIKPVNWFFLR